MKLRTAVLLGLLRDLQVNRGGFTGRDLVAIARQAGLDPDGLAKRVRHLLAVDGRFRGLCDLGKSRPDLTVFELDHIMTRLTENPTLVIQNLVDDVNQRREATNRPVISRSGLFATIVSYRAHLLGEEDPVAILRARGITVASGYDLASERAALRTIYRLSGIMTWHGLSLTALVGRLKGAQIWFARAYPGVAPERFFPAVVARADYLPGFLATINAGDRRGTQASLVFDQQVAFLVRTLDFVIDQIRRERDRLLQRMNALLQPRLQAYREEREAELAEVGERLPDTPTREEVDQLRRTLALPPDVSRLVRVRVRADLLKQSARLYLALSSLTEGFSPDLLVAHVPRAQLLLDLAAGSCSWEEVPEAYRTALGKNRHLVPMAARAGLTGEDVIHSLLIERIVEALRRGKITHRRSWAHQDLSPLILGSRPLAHEPQLTVGGLEQLLAGQYPMDLRPLLELATGPAEEAANDGEDDGPRPRVDFSEVAVEVSGLVRAATPDWIEEHRRVAAEVSGGLFRMEYDEEEFARLFYDGIGMLGCNFRYRDSPRYDGMKHFARRHLTVPALDLELRFLHRLLVEETGRRARVLLTDSIGTEAREDAYATYHGRYNTVGVADVRGVSGEMVPAACLPTPSGDTEAMHSVPLMARAYRVLEEAVEIYSGNGHTTTRICAGNLLLGFGVIGAGRFVGEPRLPPVRRQEQLRKHLPLLNQVGAFLRRYPELGSVFSARSHVYVDGVNVRQLVEDVGSLVLRQVAEAEIPLHRILPRVEASNRMKRTVRIVERGELRGHLPSLAVALTAGEVVLAISAVWLAKHRRKGESGYPSLTIGDIAFMHPA